MQEVGNRGQQVLRAQDGHAIGIAVGVWRRAWQGLIVGWWSESVERVIGIEGHNNLQEELKSKGQVGE